jgi:membrane protease YdiL (CAAX protease family)
LWVKAIRGWYQGEPFLARREQSPSPVGIVDIGVTVLIWIFLQIPGAVLIASFTGVGGKPMNELPAADLLQFTGLLMALQVLATVFAIVYLLVRHKKLGWLGTVGGLRSDLRIAGFGFLMIVPVTMAIQGLVTQYVKYEHPTLGSLEDNSSIVPLMWAWFAAGIAAPVTEEFFFRGLIQGWLQRAFDRTESVERLFLGGDVEQISGLDESETSQGHQFTETGGEFAGHTAGETENPYRTPNTYQTSIAGGRDQTPLSPDQSQFCFWMPIVITSLMFSVVHLGQGPAPIPLFFFSIGLGYLLRRTGSLIPCVAVHFLLNIVSLTLFTLQLMYPAEPELVPASTANILSIYFP